MANTFWKPLISFLVIFFIFQADLSAQRPTSKVLVLSLEREIDIVALRYTHLALLEADKQKVDALVLYINSPKVDEDYAQDIAQKLVKYPKPIWVFFTKNTPKKIEKIINTGQKTHLIQKKQEFEALLRQNNKHQINYFTTDEVEKVGEFFLNPLLSSILLILIIIGLFYQIKLPHLGLPIFISVIAGLLYFTPYYLYGLIADWEIIMFAIGFILLAIELTLIPGFGVVGIAGIGLIIASVVLMQLRNDGLDFSAVHQKDITNSLIVIALCLIGSTTFLALTIPRLLKTKQFRKISLRKTLQKEEGYAIAQIEENLVGKIGTSLTILRPIGKIQIDDKTYHASTVRGEYIEKDSPIEVVEQHNYEIKVKKID